MPKSPDVSTVIVTGNQIRVTIPKVLAEALKLEKGKKVRWRLTGKDKLELMPV